MKNYFILAALALTLSLSAQEGGKDFTYKPLKWTIKTPADYEKAEVDLEALSEGEEAIYSVANDVALETMEATVSAYNEDEDGDYGMMQELSASFMQDILQQAVEEAGGTVDVNTEKETISGKEFYHHTYTMSFEGETTIVHLFNSLIEGKDFCMDISYTNAAEGEKLLKAFRESKFK